MPDGLFHIIVVVPVTCLLILWAALSVIAIKGLLFHRHEQYPHVEISPEEDDEFPAEDAPRLPLGCLIAFGFFVWPLFLAGFVDRLIRHYSSSTPS